MSEFHFPRRSRRACGAAPVSSVPIAQLPLWRIPAGSACQLQFCWSPKHVIQARTCSDNAAGQALRVSSERPAGCVAWAKRTAFEGLIISSRSSKEGFLQISVVAA